MKPKLNIIFIILSVAVCSSFLTGCKTKQKKIPQADTKFIPYISAYTSGTISSASTIKIRLTEPSPAFAGDHKPAAEELFLFSPSLKGEAVWIDKQTIEFKPQELMKPNQVYSATFFLGKVRQVESEFAEFVFGFRIMKLSYEVLTEGLIIENSAQPDKYIYEGKIATTDFLSPDKPPQILKATYMGKTLPVSWTNDPGNQIFSFRIDHIQRNNNSNTLLLTWKGDAIGADHSGQKEIPVPSVSFFGKLSDCIVTGDEKAVYIYFSDLLDPDQDLRGMVSTNIDQITTFRIQANILKVILNESTSSKVDIRISGNLLNIKGKKLGTDLVISEPENTFANLNPQLRAVGTGTILPSSQGMIFPFEAVNLKSVKLTIIRIYETNVAYFLQSNALDGSNQLQRVGRPVFSKVIPLTHSGVTDFSKWNRFTIDLNDFIKAEPGAIYQVNITFKKRNTLTGCSNLTDEEEPLTEEEQFSRITEKFDDPNRYYYYDPFEDPPYYEEGYSWQERDNPCNPAYYTSDRMISRNILASDIGLILKRGTSGDVTIAVSDITTAKPIANVRLEIIDLQLQKLAEARSDADGFASFRLDRKPFLLIASSGNQKSYLRIDDGSSLSLSNFDVSGNEVQKGLKGFIYGERGVWRPGDSLYISFILEDKQQVIPEGHPIVFELRNPSGKLITRMVKPSHKMGMFTFKTATAPEAPTGKWTVALKAGGSVFTKQVRIETVKPNRLKINFQLNKNVPFGKEGKISATLHSQWLHGGKAGFLKSTYEVVLVKARAEFKSYGNYCFDDPKVVFYPETFPVFTGQLDANGNAPISKNLEMNKSLPSALNAYFKGKVFEPGGDFSVDFLTEPILPYETYVGMRVENNDKGRWLKADKDHTVSLVSVNKRGEPVSVKNLKVEITKQSWSWWWDENDNGDAYYYSSDYEHQVSMLSASTIGGKGSFTFRITYPKWGRFFIRVTNPATGQSCGQFVYIDWPSSYGKGESNIPGGATMLALSSDKTKCKVNETVKVTIPGMKGARAMVSLENGSRVVKAYWVDAGKTENVEEIRATPDMTPNIFINVTVVQPHKDKKNDLPIRQYGILSLDVEDPGTILTPVIRMPDQLKPEQKFNITVSEKSGKAMYYTIAMVDEGLLDLTRFKTPDPHESFYAHEALGVKTFDLYDQIIGAYGSTMERLLSIGGDEIMKQEEKGKSLRFKPVVTFLGPFSLPAGKTTTHVITMPNYIGSVRAMVVASSNSSYGFAEKTISVKQSVMVMATLPRVLRPDEEIIMPVNVFATNKSVKTVSVTVKTEGLLSLRGQGNQTVTFKGEDDKMVYFRLKVAQKIGSGKITVIANGNSDLAKYQVEIPVISSSSMVHNTTDYVLPGGGSQSVSFTPWGIPGTNGASLEVSSAEKVNFTDRIAYLLDYPYGCAEQVTSRVFAQLYLPKVIDLDKDMIRHIETSIREGIRKLTAMQRTDGGFAYWVVNSYSDDWISSYAGHFLIEASRLGYSVPEEVISKWKEFQRQQVKLWASFPPEPWRQTFQAYRLYSLALSGSPDIASMNRLKETGILTSQARWRLAAAYALAGKKEIALSMVATLPKPGHDRTYWYMTYGSELRDRAMVLETMTELDISKEALFQAKEIASILNSKTWLSTHESSYAIMALAKYYNRFSSPQPVSCTYQMNGKTEELKSLKFSKSTPLKINESGKNNLTIKNNTKSQLYVRLNESGISLKDDDINFRKDLIMSVTFTSKSGKPLNILKLKQGTEFIAVVNIRSENLFRDTKNLALRQIFPSGWEITSSNLSGPEPESGNRLYNNREIRDDRVLTFFDLPDNYGKRFTVELTATYAGKFYFPGTYCEAMYDSGIGAKDSGMWVEVVSE